MSRDPGLHTVTTEASQLPERVELMAPFDALAKPSNADMITAALTLWPQGPAWGSPDGRAVDLYSNLGRFTRVLISPFEFLYNRAYVLWQEVTVSGTSELLPEWERDYGLPDSCVSGQPTVAERVRALEAKVNSQAVLHPSDFIRVAFAYGFDIEIEEPAIFECGFSECGGEHETGDVRQEAFWVVRVRDYAIDYFMTGVSELGRDPLFSMGEAERLLCIMRRLAPAWTLPVLWSSEETYTLTDGADRPLSRSDDTTFTVTI